MKAQTAAVLALLRERGSAGVTPLEAFAAVGTWRLGARIYELRRDGYAVDTKIVRVPSGAHVASYRLRDAA